MRFTAMARHAAAFLVLALTLSAFPLVAAERDRLLVSTEWLAGHISDPGLVLLHVGDRAEYDAAHLPGARFVALRDVGDCAVVNLPISDFDRILRALTN